MIEHIGGTMICNLRRDDMKPIVAGEEALIVRYLEVPHPCSDSTCIGNINRKKLEAADAVSLACAKLANLVEAHGYCTGMWTGEHMALSRKLAGEAREAIAEAEEVAGE